ncbi:MAG: redox-sensing transcriptional repressor Rex [Thermoanaerobaculia bacterium]
MTSKEPPDTVSEATTHRLSLLLRSLRILEADGVGTVSSQQLAERFTLNAAQIRKDLAQFGEFGVRGVGYRVAELKERISAVLGLDRKRTVVVLGAGHLGQALADSKNFSAEGFRVVALFDNDRRKIGGRSRTGVLIRDVAELPAIAAAEKVEIGVLAVPAEAVPPAAVVLKNAGVRAILNFAPITLAAVPGLEVKNVDLTLFLENLSYRLAAAEERTRPKRG